MVKLKLFDVRLSGGQRSWPYLVEGGCDQHGRSPEELFVDTPGVFILDKPGPAQIFFPIHVCSGITVRWGQWPSAPGTDQHEQNAFFIFFLSVMF